ncbi:aminoacyltransferase [Aquimarina sp. RZ0]|uniref:aminoacyltransferase n=1 Tax=Aquimarina sp. RZ0 TaxID=2607730 RepID=UPI0011F2CEF3|nr:aminoacyltransferase [Aquimarina sp. RZ0]KAA1247511.1 aminoacyltransferase [Aquimarina sp. RZ0]
MKTLKKVWLIPLTLVVFLYTSCSDDDDVINVITLDAEETGVFLEQDLHLLFLSRKDDLIEEDIVSVQADLEGDPDNQDLQAQLIELEEQRATNTDQINFLNEQISLISGNEELVGIVPRIPPPPIPPSPCSCFLPLDLTRLREIVLLGNTENYAITVFSENQEVLEELGSLDSFMGTNLSSLSLSDTINFQGDVTIQVTKFFEPIQDLVTYSLNGVINP